MIKSAMFGFFNNKYYRLEENGMVAIPSRYDYKNKAISSVLDNSSETGVIKIYQYHTDLLTENNKERVEFMKELLIDEKIKEIDDLNKDYVVCVSYEIYNKDNMLIKSGSSSVKAIYNTAVILDDVSNIDTLDYRKSMIFDGSIEIQIPEISRYGIKNKYTQNPYTVKITKISICTTIGDKDIIGEDKSQVNYDNYAHTSSIMHHASPIMPKNHHGSHFVTNAKVGTTLIDQTVISTILDTDKEFELIELASIDCKSNEFITKFDSKLKMINVDVEVIVDNCNMVFNQDDILDILESNEDDSEDEPNNPPDKNPEDTKEPTEENPSDKKDKDESDNSTDIDDKNPDGENDGTTTNPSDKTPEEGEGSTDVKDPENTDEPPKNPEEGKDEESDSNTEETPSDNGDIKEPESTEDGNTTPSDKDTNDSENNKEPLESKDMTDNTDEKSDGE